MPKLATPILCNGCAACATVCSTCAISMKPDREGFLRPIVDMGRCKECGICEKTCPVSRQHVDISPLSVYAVRAKDDGLRMASSSGGVFSLLAHETIMSGGIVFGSAVHDGDLAVRHCSANNEQELEVLRGSKYVQSEIGEAYRVVKAYLKADRKVMFTGTPCQVAGLRAYLGAEYGKLLCVDVICHGVPSPLAWQRYLEARATEIKGVGSKPTDVFDCRQIFFRCKKFGWRRFAMSLGCFSGAKYSQCLDKDSFLRGFLKELFSRPSCHNCVFRNLRSGSDITIGDYWGVEAELPQMDDNLGTSAVIINTHKGLTAFNRIRESISFAPADLQDIIKHNPALSTSTSAHESRSYFFKKLTSVDFDSLVEKSMRRHQSYLFRKFAGLRMRLQNLLTGARL